MHNVYHAHVFLYDGTIGHSMTNNYLVTFIYTTFRGLGLTLSRPALLLAPRRGALLALFLHPHAPISLNHSSLSTKQFGSASLSLPHSSIHVHSLPIPTHLNSSIYTKSPLIPFTPYDHITVSLPQTPKTPLKQYYINSVIINKIIIKNEWAMTLNATRERSISNETTL